RALAVAADHPALARVDDLAAERAHPPDYGIEVCDRKIGKREPVARPGPALMQTEHDSVVLGLPATTPLLGAPALQAELQQLLPKASRPLRFVSGKLDQKSRHRHSHRTGNPLLPWAAGRPVSPEPRFPRSRRERADADNFSGPLSPVTRSTQGRRCSREH